MSDKRKEERRKAMIFTPVYDKDTKTLLGYLGDLTLQGALLIGEKPIEAGKKYNLAIEFREASEVPVKRMIIPARSLWCKIEDRETYYNVGFEFLELTEEHKQVIQMVLERFRFDREMPG